MATQTYYDRLPSEVEKGIDNILKYMKVHILSNIEGEESVDIVLTVVPHIGGGTKESFVEEEQKPIVDIVEAIESIMTPQQPGEELTTDADGYVDLGDIDNVYGE